jgi:hypothetical protein
MEDRKRRFDDTQEVKPKMADVVRRICGSMSLFDGLHVFTPHADVPDDSALRLVVLSPEKFFAKGEQRIAFDEILEVVRQHGDKPRYRGNRLLFLAPDHSSLSRLMDGIRTALAWQSILDDVQSGRLNIDRAQEQQAKKECSGAEDALPRIARECYRWLLCPVMHNPADKEPEIEVFAVNSSGSSMGNELERICRENELVITTWSPIHLRDGVLKRFYWKPEKPYVQAASVWEDMLRYLYLPRLRDRSAFEQTVSKGASGRDFFGTAYGIQDGKYEGFKLGDSFIQVDDTLLLIEPASAAAFEAENKKPEPSPGPQPIPSLTSVSEEGAPMALHPTLVPGVGEGAPKPITRRFHGSVDVSAAMAKMKLVQISDELISLLASDPNASIKVTLEISAEFPSGAKDTVKRAVSENANALNFKSKEWFA